MIFPKAIKRTAKNVVFPIIIFFIIFSGLELSYHTYKHYKYKKDIKNLDNPLITLLGPKDRLEYVFKPNSEYTLKSGITYRINSKGLRDREFNYEKPEGVYRVVALGDSYTFGWMQNSKTPTLNNWCVS